MTPSAELRARVLNAAKRERADTRGEVDERRRVFLASAVVVPLCLFFAFGGVRAEPRPAVLIAQTAVFATVVAALAVSIGIGRGRSMLGRNGVLLVGLAVLTPLLLLAGKAYLSGRFAGMTAPWPERPGFRCLRLSCSMATWPLVAIAMTRRGTDPTHPYVTGAGIGAAVGACTWVLVDLWCPVAYVPHLLVGHVLPFAVTVVSGVLLGSFIRLRTA